MPQAAILMPLRLKTKYIGIPNTINRLTNDLAKRITPVFIVGRIKLSVRLTVASAEFDPNELGRHPRCTPSDFSVRIY